MISLHSLQPIYRWRVQQKITFPHTLRLSSQKFFRISLRTLCPQRLMFSQRLGISLHSLRPLRLLSTVKFRTSLRPLRTLRLLFIANFGTSLYRLGAVVIS